MGTDLTTSATVFLQIPAYLNRSIALVSHFQSPPLSTSIQQHGAGLRWQESAWHFHFIVRGFLGVRKLLQGRYGEEAAVESLLQVSVFTPNKLVNSNQVGSCQECALDL